jgi:hypothetical protein
MDQKKLSNSAAIKLRRAQELGGLALADSYPLSHSGDAAHVKRIEDPWKKPAGK